MGSPAYSYCSMSQPRRPQCRQISRTAAFIAAFMAPPCRCLSKWLSSILHQAKQLYVLIQAAPPAILSPAPPVPPSSSHLSWLMMKGWGGEAPQRKNVAKQKTIVICHWLFLFVFSCVYFNVAALCNSASVCVFFGTSCLYLQSKYNERSHSLASSERIFCPAIYIFHTLNCGHAKKIQSKKRRD